MGKCLNFVVDQLDSFPSVADFSAAATADTLKWADLEQNVVYQIVSTRTVNTQHGQSVILSLQKADGSSCGAWGCGMLPTELLQNHMVMVSSRFLYWQLDRKRARMDESTIRISCCSCIFREVSSILSYVHILHF